jgi:hypothetical protein
MIREEIVKRLVSTGKWSRDAARLGERARYQCEYCDLPLLDRSDVYKLWQIDHIVPLSSQGEYSEFDNLAVACKPCNWDFKRDWDPRSVTGQNASRDQLIEATRDLVRKERERVEAELTRFREIVRWRSP